VIELRDQLSRHVAREVELAADRDRIAAELVEVTSQRDRALQDVVALQATMLFRYSARLRSLYRRAASRPRP
jgi:hypothetical protein